MLSSDLNSINTEQAYDKYLKILKDSTLSSESKEHNYTKITGGKYYISHAFEEGFLNSYAVSIFKNNIASTLSQVPTSEYSVIRFDFDFRAKNQGYKQGKQVNDGFMIEERLIDDTLTKYIAKVVYNMLYDMYSCCEKVYVFTREFAQTDGDTVKDGIHIMVPGMNVSKATHAELINKLRTLVKFEGYPFTNTADKIIDGGIPNSNWLLYGARKSTESHTYLLTYEYTGNDTFAIPTNDMNYHLGLVKVLSIHREGKVYGAKIQQDIVKNESPKALTYDKNTEFDAEDIAMFWKILDALPPKYYQDYDEWYKIGFMLSGGSNKDQRFLEMWIKFSQKCMENYNEEKTYQIWNTASTNNNIYHLFNLAKINMTEKEYSEIKNNNSTSRLAKLILYNKLEVLDMAEYISSIIKDMKRTDIINDKNVDMYHFDNIWVKESSPKVSLVNDVCGIIKTNLASAVKKATSFLLSNNTDGAEVGKRLGAVKKLLTSSHARNINIATAISELNINNGGINYPGFSSQLDSIRSNVIAFKNCVVDLKSCTKRQGIQDDNLTFYFPVDYNEYDPKSNEALQLKLLFENWFPNEKYRQAVIDKLSLSLLYNINGDNQVFFFKGSGRNGKSVFMNLIREGFGVGDFGLAKSVPIDFFIAGNKSTLGTASPDLHRTRKAKILLTEETNQNDKLNCALFKKLSGGDMLSVRDLYKPVIEFKCAFRIFFAVNNMPKFTSIDDSLSRRIVIIPFENRFVLKPKEKNEKKIIDDIDDIIKQVAPCFMAFLVENYKNKFMGNKRKVCVIPEEIMAETNKYVMDSSPIRKYIGTYIEKTGNQNDKIEVSLIIQKIYQWAAKNNYPAVANYDPTTIIDALKFEFNDLMTDTHVDSVKFKDAVIQQNDDKPVAL
jgi:P4 family phage/plasmid primase-like protien